MVVTSTTASSFALRFDEWVDEVRVGLANASSVDDLQRGPLQVFAQARTQLTASTPVLTAHDRARYESTLAELRTLIDDQRKLFAERGFRFKRKPRTAAPKPAAEPTSKPSTSISEPISDTTIGDLDNRLYLWSQGHESQDKVSLDIAQVARSVVDLRSARNVGSVQMRNVSHSIVLLPQVEGSVMAHALTDSLLICPSAHQVRIHDSHASTLQVATKYDSFITIDHCTSLRFLVDPHGLPVQIQDFDCLTSSLNYTLVHHADITPSLAPLLHTDPPDVAALMQSIV